MDQRFEAPPRAVAEYLRTVKDQVRAAAEVRQRWIREIGRLIEDARHANRRAVAQAAGGIGRAYLPAFQEAQAGVGRLNPPSDCLICHRAVLAWLDAQVGSCEVMIDAGVDEDVGRLRDAQRRLADGRLHAHVFNDEYTRLVGRLRQLAEAASRRQRERERHPHGAEAHRGRLAPVA